MSFLKRIKNSLIIIACLFSLQAHAQKVDTIQINGEDFFVYPFRISVNVHRDYYQLIKLESTVDFSYRQYRKEIAKEFGEDMSKKEFKKLMKSFGEMQRQDDRKYINNKFRKAARKNPYPLLEQRYTINQDIVPSLDPIPDGKYVQMFESFCLTDRKGDCDMKEEHIAGYFTIKNNMLHGRAIWLNIHGDTLKQGKYQNGLKVGEWKIETRKLDYALSKMDVQQYIERGYPSIDTTIEITHWVNGAKTGKYQRYFSSKFPVEEGEYLDGNRIGEWVYRDITFKGRGKNRRRIRDNELITKRYTLNDSNDSTVVKVPWIRNGLIETYDANQEIFNFDSKYGLESPPLQLFTIAFEKDSGLDMEEERYGSYEVDEYSDDMYYEMEGFGDYGYSYEFSFYQPTVYDKERDKTLKRGYVVDSIGMTPNYKNAYEIYYPNGQLAFHYEFKEGKLIAEDTIFWDNGQAHDVIVFIPDSNKYTRTIYDYEGKLYKQFSIDSLGDYVRTDYEYSNAKFVELDGFKAEDPEYGSYYFYNKYDTLASDLKEPLIVFRSWYKEDSSKLYNTFYDPSTRELTRHQYAVTGKASTVSRKTFSESFESWTGKDSTEVGPLKLITTSTGALYEGDYYKDSIPQNNVNFPYTRFDVASEFLIQKDGQNYTGPVSIQFNKSSFSISKKDLTVKLPKLKKSYVNKVEKLVKKYRTSGKIGDPVLLNYIDASDYNRNFGAYFYIDIFNQTLNQMFDFPDDYSYGHENDYYYGDYATEDNREYPEVQKIEGYMIDGKPHGIWRSYDQFKKVMSEVAFEEGDPHGTTKQFSYAYPMVETDYYDYGPEAIADSFPDKKVYFLNNIYEYKSGMLDGNSIEYVWYGEIASETSYSEDMKSGPAYERNPLAISKMNYQNNVLDGYLQTYLTLEGKDSILLYDLNFQDGLLQGESKSYHLNGQLSKKGFFLNGDPIDDYEAYDSLGFKYHYVKFKYSFPVEEKIWEENELSVRYLFDWQDSIYFEPSDITTSHSLEKMLFDLGFGRDYLYQPYYGRPTLVDKKGVKYHMTKYYPNDTIARDGDLDKGKKTGCWKFFDYDGELLYEVDYFDTIIVLNDSIKFKSKGILTEIDENGNVLYESYIIEKFEKYDCAHTDHYEIRQLYTIWQCNDSLGRINGYVKNYYDNGVIQSEGELKDGLPVGFWKIYDPYGKLNQYGQYVLGKRDGRWLSGDLSKTKYLGDICLNPNLPDLEKEIKYRENLLDITITNYKLGKSLNKQFYDINMNRFLDLDEEEGIESEGDIPPPPPMNH